MRALAGPFVQVAVLDDVVDRQPDARVEVARDLDAPALVTLPLVLTRADAGRVVASGTVPLGALPPGDYVVRGVVRLESGETGRVVRTLRKVAKPRAGL